jgi:hypothetical protein
MAYQSTTFSNQFKKLLSDDQKGLRAAAHSERKRFCTKAFGGSLLAFGALGVLKLRWKVGPSPGV